MEEEHFYSVYAEKGKQKDCIRMCSESQKNLAKSLFEKYGWTVTVRKYKKETK